MAITSFRTAEAGRRPTGSKEKQARRERGKSFAADSEEMMKVLPAHVRLAWNFSDTGRILSEASLTDFIRSSATKASWSSIADVIAEIKNTAWSSTMGEYFLSWLVGLVHGALAREMGSTRGVGRGVPGRCSRRLHANACGAKDDGATCWAVVPGTSSKPRHV